MFSYKEIRQAAAGSRRLLYVAGAYNFGAALILVLLARFAPQSLGVDALHASQLLYVDLSALLITGFGIGYVLGGVNLARFWPFIALGAVCKAGLVVLVGAYFITGNAGPLAMLLAAGDAVFSVLFVRLLRAHAVA